MKNSQCQFGSRLFQKRLNLNMAQTKSYKKEKKRTKFDNCQCKYTFFLVWNMTFYINANMFQFKTYLSSDWGRLSIFSKISEIKTNQNHPLGGGGRGRQAKLVIFPISSCFFIDAFFSDVFLPSLRHSYMEDP